MNIISCIFHNIFVFDLKIFHIQVKFITFKFD